MDAPSTAPRDAPSIDRKEWLEAAARTDSASRTMIWVRSKTVIDRQGGDQTMSSICALTWRIVFRVVRKAALKGSQVSRGGFPRTASACQHRERQSSGSHSLACGSANVAWIGYRRERRRVCCHRSVPAAAQLTCSGTTDVLPATRGGRLRSVWSAHLMQNIPSNTTTGLTTEPKKTTGF